MRGSRTHLRSVDTTLMALGFPGRNATPVQQLHLEGMGTVTEAVATYRRVFGLSDDASISIRSTPGRTEIDSDPNGSTVVRLPQLPTLTSTAMIVHR